MPDYYCYNPFLFALVWALWLQKGIRHRDTITLHDTLTNYITEYVEKPVPVETKVTDTIYYPKDSLIVEVVHDTSFICLPRTASLFQGDNYQLQISGYEASLDWIKITAVERTIIEKQVPENNRISFGAMLYASSYATVIPSVEYSRIFGESKAYIKAGYDLIGKRPVALIGADICVKSW